MTTKQAINEIIVDVAKVMMTGATVNVNINIHPKKFTWIKGLKTGDKLLFPSRKTRNSLIKRKVIGINNGTIKTMVGKRCFIYNIEGIAKLNNRDIETAQSSNIKLYKEEKYKTFFQVVYYHNDLTDTDRPFSLSFIIDKGYYSDWTEWSFSSLDRPVEAKFKMRGNVITKIY